VIRQGHSVRQASALFRSVLALLLVCAQIFAAAHAVGHLGELLRSGPTQVASASYEGGLPAAERHERCLQCLAAADLASAIPPALLPMAFEATPLALPGEGDVPSSARRLPRPHSRGPPSSSV